MPPQLRCPGILIVDDEPAVCDLIGAVLETKSYKVWTARSCGEALKLFEEHHVELALLVTDIIMPTMSGPELVDALLALKPDLAVLFVSGFCGGYVGRLRKFQCLPKPFTADELLHKVEELLPIPQATS